MALAVGARASRPAGEAQPKKWENEPATLFGERVMLGFSTERDARLLQSVTRSEEVDERISRIRAYYLCPETVQEVGETEKLPVGYIPDRIPTL